MGKHKGSKRPISSQPDIKHVSKRNLYVVTLLLSTHLPHFSQKLILMEKKLLQYYILMEDPLFHSGKSPNDLGWKVPLELV